MLTIRNWCQAPGKSFIARPQEDQEPKFPGVPGCSKDLSSRDLRRAPLCPVPRRTWHTLCAFCFSSATSAPFAPMSLCPLSFCFLLAGLGCGLTWPPQGFSTQWPPVHGSGLMLLQVSYFTPKRG